MAGFRQCRSPAARNPCRPADATGGICEAARRRGRPPLTPPRRYFRDGFTPARGSGRNSEHRAGQLSAGRPCRCGCSEQQCATQSDRRRCSKPRARRPRDDAGSREHPAQGQARRGRQGAHGRERCRVQHRRRRAEGDRDDRDRRRQRPVGPVPAGAQGRSRVRRPVRRPHRGRCFGAHRGECDRTGVLRAVARHAAGRQRGRRAGSPVDRQDGRPHRRAHDHRARPDHPAHGEGRAGMALRSDRRRRRGQPRASDRDDGCLRRRRAALVQPAAHGRGRRGHGSDVRRRRGTSGDQCDGRRPLRAARPQPVDVRRDGR